ncbi:hypothetical protein CDAR_493431 [Caerostris darwini]|uniref:Uncharacterized protein n=1 Tax=Caerostris darwini TaxID=1538125 RepID=A0AAV4QGH4_9ARAC|nr:hypothetical protein CDAR_493431 [Caerostris darwini]
MPNSISAEMKNVNTPTGCVGPDEIFINRNRNASTVSSGIENRYHVKEIIVDAKIRSVRQIKHPFNVLTGRILYCLGRCVRARFVMMKNNPALPVVVFSYFPQVFWQINVRAEWIVLRFFSGAVNKCPFNQKKKTGDYLLRSDFASDENKFCWVLAHIGRSIQPNAFHFLAHMHRSA